MKKIAAVCIVWIVAASFPAPSQDHAPTVAQCQADEKVWGMQTEESGAFPPGTANLSLDDLLERSEEMSSCIAVDRSHRESYAFTAMALNSQIETRLWGYIHETGQSAQYDAWELKKQREALH